MTTITSSKVDFKKLNNYPLTTQNYDKQIIVDQEENSTDSKTNGLFFEKFQSNDDFGHIKKEKCYCTFSPMTFEQLYKIVIEFAQKIKIPINCRGQAYSTGGQAQVKNGILIDFSNLNKIYPPKNEEMSVKVECGALWKDVVDECLKFELTPPVLPDFLGLSVGGVLSVGGISGQTHQHGLVADNVIELKVMTLDGKIHSCSKTQNTDLFNASLATLGQFTIILEATLKLIPAPNKCKTFFFYYDDLNNFMKNQTDLIKNKVFNYLQGHIVPSLNNQSPSNVTKNWGFVIEAAHYQYDDLERFPFDFGTLKTINVICEEKSYKDFIFRREPSVDLFKKNGSWYHPHPSIQVFIPQDHAYKIVNGLMKSLTLNETGGWPISLSPFNKSALSALSCPYFQTPDSEIFWSFSILRHAKDDQTAEEMIQKNRMLYDKIAAIGGKIYPTGSTPMFKNDWKAQYGTQWKEFKNLKKEDHLYLLGRGPGIFKHKEKF